MRADVTDSTPVFVAAGEALIDLIEADDGRFDARLGGSVFNFCVALARLGVPGAYANPLSVDGFGRRFRAALDSVSVRLLSPDPVSEPTSIAVVGIDASGRAEYAFHRASVADRAFETDRLLPRLAGARAIHFGCLALVPEDVDRYLQLASSVAGAGGIVSVDANLRVSIVQDRAAYVEAVESAIAHAHVLKVSDEDLLHLGQVRGIDDDAALIGACHRLLDRNPRCQLVALTLGAGGAMLISRSAVLRARAPAEIAVVDTVGAGDCFAAALCASLWRDLEWGAPAAGDFGRRLVPPDGTMGVPPDGTMGVPALAMALATALQWGVAGGTINVSRAGCDPGTLAQVESLARQVDVRVI